jgi:hypothetical protein
MVKASNKAQQRRRLPRASTTSSSKRSKPKPKAAVNVGHGPHFRTPIARAYADNIKQLCLDNYNEQDIPPGKKRPPRSLESFVDYYKYDMENSWLTLEMVKGRRKNKKKSNNRKQQQKKNRKKPPASSTTDHAPGSQELRDTLNEADEPGRPKGKTNASKEADLESFTKMKNEIVCTWSDISKRPKRIILQAYIQQVQSQYGLDPIEFPVTDGMVHSRMRRNRLNVQGVGQVSPMLAVEPRIVMFIKLSTNCNNTMNRKEIIRFANSYIKDTAIEQEVIAWKVHHHPKWKNDFINNNVYPERAELGTSWYRGFLNRWKNHIQYKSAKNVAFNRTEHCTYGKFVEMYDSVYKLLVADGYASPMLHPKYYDALGKQCGKDDINRFGELVDLTFKYPELVLVADECGTNTNMSKEKLSAGNMKHASTLGITATIPACTSDCHFTTMVWTALTGEPVMVVVIIEKESELTWAESHGFDIDARWIGDDSFYNRIKYSPDSEARLKEAMKNEVFPEALLKLNTGPGRAFPGGPVCTFQGHTIPSVVRRSSSGGITPEILVGVLQHYDKHVPRKEGDPSPAAILDGHGSRLSIEFLRYINNLDRDGEVVDGSNHQWNIYLGLPNATAYWQVGDSSEQNGAFKNLQRKVKEDIRDRQRLFYENNKISRHHCVFILHQVFPDCYGNVEGNKKAILQRGWNPLNRGCLSIPEILKSKPTDNAAVSTAVSTAVITDTSSVNDYNVSNGESMHYLSILQTSHNRDVAREVHHQKQMKASQEYRKDNTKRASMIDKMANGRFTGGVYVRNGNWKLGSTALEVVEQKNKQKLNDLALKASRQYTRDMKIYNNGKIAMEKSTHHYNSFKEDGVLFGVPNGNDRRKIIAGLRKEKHWLLSDDYNALIKYKQLSTTTRPKIPPSLDARKVAWDSTYFAMNDPTPPVKPANFAVDAVVDVVDDDSVDVDIDIASLATTTFGTSRAETFTRDHEAAVQSLLILKTSDPNYHGAQPLVGNYAQI